MAQLKNQNVFAVLASLATDPKTSSREKIAARLWPNSPGPLNNLRPVLFFLRKAVGPDMLVEEGDTLRLAPGALITDLSEIANACDRAKRSDCPEKRAEILREMDLRLNGDFLEGFEEATDATDRWLSVTRQWATELTDEATRLLADALTEVGDARGAAEVRRRVYGIIEPAPVPKRPPTFRDLLPHWEALHRDGLMLTPREERLASATLSAELTKLPESLRRGFCRLSVFPQSFTARQAERIAQVDANALARLRASCLVWDEATLIGSDDAPRFFLLPALRRAAWRRLTSGEQQSIRERHAHYFYQFEGDGWPERNSEQPRLWGRVEFANYTAAVNFFLEREATDEVVIFYTNVNHATADLPWAQQEICQRIADYLETTVQQSLSPLSAYNLTESLAHIAVTRSDFSGAACWFRRAVEYWELVTGTHHQDVGMQPSEWRSNLVSQLTGLLTTAHHAGDDAAFDEVKELSLRLLPTLPDPQIALLIQVNMLYLFAENGYARGNLEQALEANTARFGLLPELFRLTPWRADYLPAAHYQRGLILSRLGRIEDALAALDTALTGFREWGERGTHGVADCLQEMGIALAEQGLFSVARENIERAIAIYSERDNANSRVAALGSLGDVALRQGRHEEAHALYTEGREHWQAQNHPRWIQKFTDRLARLEETPGGKEL